MTKPSIGELLNGVVIGLRESVLPELPSGPTRRQLQVAIAIIRRVAMVWDKVAPYLYLDNKDIDQTVIEICALLERGQTKLEGIEPAALRRRLNATESGGDGGAQIDYPPYSALAARNVELQQLLVDLQEALHASASQNAGAQARADIDRIAAVLQALFRRMLERELRVNSPPQAVR
jgi:hypothetical protein